MSGPGFSSSSRALDAVPVTSSSVESSGRIETIIAAIYARKSDHEMSRSEEDP
jgi:hypothetical protein